MGTFMAASGFLLLCLATGASAQYNRPSAEKDFSKVDLDSNGHMHHHEGHQLLDTKFEKEFDAWHRHFDKNNDGKVTRTEYFATDGSLEEYWSSTDLNQDGIITRNEAKEARDLAHPNRVQTYLNYFDADGDGKVSQAEFD